VQTTVTSGDISLKVSGKGLQYQTINIMSKKQTKKSR
jgi:hypothetical protein